MCPYDALYARQSLDKKDSISIESQIDFCKYETRGGDYKVYVDRGFSGKNMNRPDFERMMGDVRAGRVKRVIVYKLDRISRSILDFSNMMAVFQEYGVEFVSSTEKFDTSAPIGRAMLNICIVFAQLERETIQRRIADAYHTKSQKGYYMGGRVPYGFKLEKTVIGGIRTSRFVPEAEEMEQVLLIYRLYSEPDMTLAGVIHELTKRGMEKRRGASWCASRVSEILKNPVYVMADLSVYRFLQEQGAHIVNLASEYIGTNGVFLYRGVGGDERGRLQCELTGREAVLAPHAGVIAPDVWLKCRTKLLKNRSLARTNKGKRTWLAGKVKCMKCGYAYTIVTSKTKAGRYFRCSGTRYDPGCTGSDQTVYADKLEEYVGDEIKKVLLGFGYLSEKTDVEEPAFLNRQATRIAWLDQEIEALLDRVPDADEALMTYINRKVKRLDGEKQELLKKKINLSSKKPIITINRLSGYVELWEKLSLDDKQRVADILINAVYIGDGEIVIEWNLEAEDGEVVPKS